MNEMRQDPSGESPDSAPPLPESRGRTEDRLGHLGGNRLCIRCGFNLQGQAITREPTYGMLIVRCPECGAVASLQEYPLLGRWTYRLAAVLAGAWLCALTLGAIATGLLIGGGAIQIAERVAEPLGEVLYVAYIDAFEPVWQKQYQRNGNTYQRPPATAFGSVDKSWAESQDVPKMVAEYGGLGLARWGSPLGQPGRWAWAILLGAIWSVLLFGMHRRTVLLVMLVLVALGFGEQYLGLRDGILAALSPSQISIYYFYEYPIAINVVLEEVGLPVVVFSYLFMFIPLAIGVSLGRPLVRLFVTTFVPPHLQGSLEFLWSGSVEADARAQR